MKTAIFYNFLDNIGGAERLCLIMAQKLNADIYTTNYDPDKIKRMGFGDIKIKSIGQVPINAPFRQEATLWRFKRLNLGNRYDRYIIAGDWAVSASANHKIDLMYVHSPIREIWDLNNYVKKNIVPRLTQPVFTWWTKRQRRLNQYFFNRVETVVCNSQNVAKRIKKYLNREAVVIYPPIDTKKYHFIETGDFWLSVNRLIWHKQIEKQLEVFRLLPEERLIIVGSYEKSHHFKQYAQKIEHLKPDNVTIKSWVPEEELIELYGRCIGFLTTALNEDFGLTAVEAMAAGKAVIAPRQGGYKETIVDGQTGFLLNNLSSSAINQAMRRIKAKPDVFRQPSLNQATKFDTDVFIKQIKTLARI